MTPTTRARTLPVLPLLAAILALAATAIGSEAHAEPAATHDAIHLDGTEGWVEAGDGLHVRFEPDNEPGDPTPMNAASCNQAVCLYIESASFSNLYVQRWETTAAVTSATCSRARFHRNGSILQQTSTICSQGSGTLKAIWNNPGWFFDGDQLCNSWTNINGYPCAIVRT